MSIRFVCPYCSTNLITADHVGKSMPCPQCNRLVQSPILPAWKFPWKIIIPVSIVSIVGVVGFMFILLRGWRVDEPVKVEQADLFKAYEKDVITADKKYTGQTVELTDIDSNVRKDRRGRYYLVAAESARGVNYGPQR